MARNSLLSNIIRADVKHNSQVFSVSLCFENSCLRDEYSYHVSRFEFIFSKLFPFHRAAVSLWFLEVKPPPFNLHKSWFFGLILPFLHLSDAYLNFHVFRWVDFYVKLIISIFENGTHTSRCRGLCPNHLSSLGLKLNRFSSHFWREDVVRGNIPRPRPTATHYY